jgi:hypothetical protein
MLLATAAITLGLALAGTAPAEAAGAAGPAVTPHAGHQATSTAENVHYRRHRHRPRYYFGFSYGPPVYSYRPYYYRPYYYSYYPRYYRYRYW